MIVNLRTFETFELSNLQLATCNLQPKGRRL
jgi:hypothetical protein